MGRKVWWNGNIIEEKDAKISIYSSALMFGDMIFEMTRSFNKSQFKLEEHLERLYKSAKVFHIEMPIKINELYEACGKIQEENEKYFDDSDEHRLMINVDRGTLSIYKDIEKEGTNVIISDFPLKWTVRGFSKYFDLGINAVIPKQQHIPSNLLDPKVKCRSRAHFMQANWEVSQIKGINNWALLTDSRGFITEFTGSNFFIIKDYKLITPKSSILRGISRQYVIYLSQYAYLELVEKDIELYDVLEADEAFATATPFCILPVTKINGQDIGNGKFGPKTKELLILWSKSVFVDIEKQIRKWDLNQDTNSSGISPYEFKS